jgi:hypothetical protein
LLKGAYIRIGEFSRFGRLIRGLRVECISDWTEVKRFYTLNFIHDQWLDLEFPEDSFLDGLRPM